MLEDRLVLSGQVDFFPTTYFPSSGLAAVLTGIGVMTDSVQINQAPAGTYSPQTGSDFAALENEFVSLGAKSGVTVADLTNLNSDLSAISQGWSSLTGQGLWSAVSELANAVASGTSTSQAHADWSAMFSGSGVSQQAIDQTFSDLAQTIQDSHVTTTDLATVTADETALVDDWNDQSGDDLDIQQQFTAEGLYNQGYGYFIAPPQTGGDFEQTLSSLGVLTDVGPSDVPWATGQSAQIDSDVQNLQTEFQSLAEKSGLTAADLNNLSSDGQAITQLLFSGAGIGVNWNGAQSATSELASAVAAGTSTAQAHADFIASFTSGMPQSVLDKAFGDLVQAVEDSHVTTADLTAVANDEAAYQSDESAFAAQQLANSSSGGGFFSDHSANGGNSIPVAMTIITGTASTSTGSSPAVASQTTPAVISVVEKSKAKDKKSHKAAAKVVAHGEHQRLKATGKGHEAKKHTLAKDRR
jgi:hypothetical protein